VEPTLVISGGTVAGRHHARAGRNNQDALAWRQGERALVAAVCDGCSSGAQSEVGARLGCELIVQALFEAVAAAPSPLEALEQARTRVLDELSRLARAMSGAEPGAQAFTQAVGETLLFTIVGAVVTGSRAWAFALGDGVISVNGATEVLGPFPGNAPPYLGYALCGGPATAIELRPLPGPAGLTSLVLATDGAAGLDLAPFTTDPRVLTNPDMVRRLIWLQGRERALDDDATAIVVRRAP
jgi:hypothetical protein